MKPFLRYQLYSFVTSFSFWLYNIIVFLALGLLINYSSTECIGIQVEDSASFIYSALQKEIHEDYYYDLSTHDITLNYEDEKWVILSEQPMDQMLLLQIENDLLTASNPISAINLINEYQKNSNGGIVVAIEYFMISCFGLLLANEVLNQKGNHTLELILSIINGRQHLKCTLLSGYLKVLIQLFLIMTMALFWNAVTPVYNTEILEQITIPVLQYCLIGAHLLVGLLLIQLLGILLVVSVRRVEHGVGLQSCLYGLALVGYYSFLVYGTEGLLSSFATVIGCIPVFSFFIMPVQLYCGVVSDGAAVGSLIVEIVVYLGLLRYCVPFYEKHLLN